MGIYDLCSSIYPTLADNIEGYNGYVIFAWPLHQDPLLSIEHVGIAELKNCVPEEKDHSSSYPFGWWRSCGMSSSAATEKH